MVSRLYLTILTASVVINTGLALPSAPYLEIQEGNMFNCESTNPIAILLEGSMTPERVPIPGQSVISVRMIFTDPLPTDLQLSLNITKLEPFPALIPCLGGSLGSCTYDVCPIFEEFPAICSIFPPSLPCECPLIEGTYSLNGITINVPAVDPLLAELMKGNYIGRAVMKSKSHPFTIACLEFRFALVVEK